MVEKVRINLHLSIDKTKLELLNEEYYISVAIKRVIKSTKPLSF